MIKKDIANKICMEKHLPIQKGLIYTNKIIELIKEELKSGVSVKIRGFGNLIVRDKKLGKARHLKTQQTLEIAPGKVVKFKAGHRLKKLSN
jgi:nucleoid DNA-binding protein